MWVINFSSIGGENQSSNESVVRKELIKMWSDYHDDRCKVMRIAHLSVRWAKKYMHFHTIHLKCLIYFLSLINYWLKTRAPPTGAGRLTFSYLISSCKQFTKLYILLTYQQIGVNTFYKCIEFQVNSFDSYVEFHFNAYHNYWEIVFFSSF